MQQAVSSESRPPSTDVDRQRLLDVLTMHRISHRADGSASLLRWLARRSGCWTALLDRRGDVLVESNPGLDLPGESLLARALAEMLERDLPAFVESDGPGRRVVLLAVDVGAGRPSPVLAILGREGIPATLPADAALVLATCWSAEQTRRTQKQVELAEARCREAVLHLLMSGQLSTAGQLASTLSPALPDPMRVHVVECPRRARREVVERCAELTRGAAWTVRCPVRSRHVIVLAPVSSEARPWEVALAETEGCVVGTGDVVALRDAAMGYEQAFHALAVARGRAQRWARFDAALDLPTVLGAPGLVWANALLTPLLSHVPARASDPDAQELMATARSWLSFSTAATRHLKIHRNTLAIRLRRLEELLGLDLSRAGQQAALHLAIRIRATPRPMDATAAHLEGQVELDDLLTLPAANHWARALLRPVRDAPQGPVLESTLREWLGRDSRLSATADALGLSVAGARKRVVRLEEILKRSLLNAPSARHDLWLAVRALDLGRDAPDHSTYTRSSD